MVIAQGPADSITLAQALARARANRPQMGAAAALAARGRASSGVLNLIPNPNLQVEFDEDAPTRKAVVGQPLSWLLRRANDRAAGRALTLGGIADSARVIITVERDVRHAFFRALGAQELVRLIGEQSHLADSVVNVMHRRLDAGDVSIIERDQAALEAGHMRLTLSRAREGAAVAHLDLARALGDPGAAVPVPGGPLDASLDVSASEANTADIDDSPAVRIAVADSVATAARARSATIARLPIPSLIAGVEWGPSGTLTNRIVGFSVPVPLFNSGGGVRAEAVAMAELAAARAGEERLAARAAIDGAAIRVSEARVRAVYARDSLVPVARRLRAGSIRLLDEGRVDLLPVIDAMRSERDAIQSLVNELVAFQVAMADYHALIGRTEW